MRKIYSILILLLLNYDISGQVYTNCNQVPSSLFPLPLPRDKGCDDHPKVKDERPENCDDLFLYPVINENFDYKEDLPNNYIFNTPGKSTDGWGSAIGTSWLGDPYNNGNIDCQNGELLLKLKKENINGYSFSNGFLLSLYRLREGVFEAKIKFPNNLYMWSAYWMQWGAHSDGNYQEIDWCEMFDNNPFTNPNAAVCEPVYHWLRMNVYEQGGCNRSRRYCLSDGFFNDFHVFRGIWTNYKIEFYVDNSRKAFATKYYDGPFVPITLCQSGDVGRLVPTNPRSCSYMKDAEACDVMVFNTCVKWNRVHKDISFPNPSIPMNIYINSIVNYNIGNISNTLSNQWNNFSDVDKMVKVDYLKIYQPIKCYTDYTVLNEPQFKSITGGTNFLSGRKITISNGTGNNLYINESPKASNSWHEFPTHILATDEIAFLNDVAFEEGTFLRAEIISCSGPSVSQRTTNNSNDTLPPVLPIDYFDKQDSFYVALQNYYNSPLVSETDNGALQIFPNPTSNHFHISMAEEDFNDLKKIEIVNTLGQVKELPIRESQDISDLAEGIYMVKFYFSTGMLVVKSLIIKR
jgi:beta-glucanase (GH16 family)